MKLNEVSKDETEQIGNQRIRGLTITHRRGGGLLIIDKVIDERCYVVACGANELRDSALIKCVTPNSVSEIEVSQKGFAVIIGNVRAIVSLGLPRYDEDLVRMVYNANRDEYHLKELKEYEMPPAILRSCGLL